eukprot:EG_transcript_70930
MPLGPDPMAAVEGPGGRGHAAGQPRSGQRNDGVPVDMMSRFRDPDAEIAGDGRRVRGAPHMDQRGAEGEPVDGMALGPDPMASVQGPDGRRVRGAPHVD